MSTAFADERRPPLSGGGADRPFPALFRDWTPALHQAGVPGGALALIVMGGRGGGRAGLAAVTERQGRAARQGQKEVPPSAPEARGPAAGLAGASGGAFRVGDGLPKALSAGGLAGGLLEGLGPHSWRPHPHDPVTSQGPASKCCHAGLGFQPGNVGETQP